MDFGVRRAQLRRCIQPPLLQPINTQGSDRAPPPKDERRKEGEGMGFAYLDSEVRLPRQAPSVRRVWRHQPMHRPPCRCRPRMDLCLLNIQKSFQEKTVIFVSFLTSSSRVIIEADTGWWTRELWVTTRCKHFISQNTRSIMIQRKQKSRNHAAPHESKTKERESESIDSKAQRWEAKERRRTRERTLIRRISVFCSANEKHKPNSNTNSQPSLESFVLISRHLH